MSKRVGNLGAVAAIALAVLVIVSCGSNNNSTGPTISSAERYAEIDSFMTQLAVPMALATMGTQHIDGVDDDLPLPGAGRIVAGRLSAYESANDEVLSYDDQTGWWVYTADVDTVFLGASFSYHALDSVQFRTVGGAFQRDPDELTDVIDNYLDFSLSIGSDEGSFGFEIVQDAILSGLTGSIVTVNGTFDFDLEFSGKNDEGEQVDGTVSIDMDLTDITVPNVDEDDPCPLSGTLTLVVTEDISAQLANGSVQGQATWNMTMTILSGGMADVTVTGPAGFTYQGTEEICDQPL